MAKKKADLEAKIADLEKEFDVEKKMLKHDLEVTRERLQKEIAGLQKELNKESKKVDKAVMDLGLLEFRVATAEQEKITLDQRIQAHKAELKQQQVGHREGEPDDTDKWTSRKTQMDKQTAPKKNPKGT